MDTHGKSEQHAPGQPVARPSRQRGRHGLGEASDRIRQAVGTLVEGWKAAHVSYVLMYLIAIIIANLDIVWFQNRFGTSPESRLFITSANAFLFIGLDLTARDALHDAWHGRGLVPKMAALIAAGSALSWLLNRDAGRIAVASFAAFACAGTADAIVYALLGGRARLLKVNGSNVVSAAVDSFVFPAAAFGFPLLVGVMVGQFAAKVLGGFVWSLLLMRAGRQPRPVAKGA